MQIMGPSNSGMYYGYPLLGLGIDPSGSSAVSADEMSVDEVRSLIAAIPAAVKNSAAYKDLGEKSRIMLGRMYRDMTFADVVSLNLARLQNKASGKRTAAEIQDAKGGIDLGFWTRLGDQKTWQGMGANNKYLTGQLLTAPDADVVAAYYAWKNGTAFKPTAFAAKVDGKILNQYDSMAFAKSTVDYIMPFRFPKGVPTQTAEAAKTGNEAAAKSGASNEAAKQSGNAAAADATSKLNDEVKRLNAEVQKLTTQANAATTTANTNADAAAKARKDAEALRAQLRGAEADAKDREAALLDKAAKDAQATKDAYERAASDAAAYAAQLADQAAQASSLAASRGTELVALQQRFEEMEKFYAEKSKKDMRNILLGVGALAAVGGLVWYMRRK